MLKSKGVRILVRIIIIWMLVTIYFYFQHPVVYRYQDLNINIPIGNGQLLIHEIRVHNLDEDKQMSGWRNEEMPWYYQLMVRAHEMGMPISWQGPVLKVISFYSRPPLAEDYWALQIEGTFIIPDDVDADADEHPLDRFAVSIYPGIINSKGSQRETLHNAVIINARGIIDPRQMDQPLLLTVTDKENGKPVRLIFTPEWQKERYWQRGDQFNSPAVPVRNFLYQVCANKPQQALENVLLPLRKEFPLPEPNASLQGKNIEIEGRLTWVDIFEDYLNVYRVDAEVDEFSENSFIPQQKLTFYTVRDEGGKYKIIYWKYDE